jgi:hypothetical protein
VSKRLVLQSSDPDAYYTAFCSRLGTMCVWNTYKRSYLGTECGRVITWFYTVKFYTREPWGELGIWFGPICLKGASAERFLCSYVFLVWSGRSHVWTCLWPPLSPAYAWVYILRKEKTIKIVVLNSSNDNRASAIFFDCHVCRMLTLAFIWLTLSFERTSYYTLLP